MPKKTLGRAPLKPHPSSCDASSMIVVQTHREDGIELGDLEGGSTVGAAGAAGAAGAGGLAPGSIKSHSESDKSSMLWQNNPQRGGGGGGTQAIAPAPGKLVGRRGGGYCGGIACVCCILLLGCLLLAGGIVAALWFTVPAIKCALGGSGADCPGSAGPQSDTGFAIYEYETSLPLDYESFLGYFSMGPDGDCTASMSCSAYVVRTIAKTYGADDDESITLISVTNGSVVIAYEMLLATATPIVPPTTDAWQQSGFYDLEIAVRIGGGGEIKSTSVRSRAAPAPPVNPPAGGDSTSTSSPAALLPPIKETPWTLANGSSMLSEELEVLGLPTSAPVDELSSDRRFSVASLADLQEGAIKYVKDQIIDKQKDKLEAAVHNLGAVQKINETMIQMMPEMNKAMEALGEQLGDAFGNGTLAMDLYGLLAGIESEGIMETLTARFSGDEDPASCDAALQPGAARRLESGTNKLSGFDRIVKKLAEWGQSIHGTSCQRGKCSDMKTTWTTNPTFGLTLALTGAVDPTHGKCAANGQRDSICEREKQKRNKFGDKLPRLVPSVTGAASWRAAFGDDGGVDHVYQMSVGLGGSLRTHSNPEAHSDAFLTILDSVCQRFLKKAIGLKNTKDGSFFELFTSGSSTQDKDTHFIVEYEHINDEDMYECCTGSSCVECSGDLKLASGFQTTAKDTYKMEEVPVMGRQIGRCEHGYTGDPKNMCSGKSVGQCTHKMCEFKQNDQVCKKKTPVHRVSAFTAIEDLFAQAKHTGSKGDYRCVGLEPAAVCTAQPNCVFEKDPSTTTAFSKHAQPKCMDSTAKTRNTKVPRYSLATTCTKLVGEAFCRSDKGCMWYKGKCIVMDCTRINTIGGARSTEGVCKNTRGCKWDKKGKTCGWTSGRGFTDKVGSFLKKGAIVNLAATLEFMGQFEQQRDDGFTWSIDFRKGVLGIRGVELYMSGDMKCVMGFGIKLFDLPFTFGGGSLSWPNLIKRKIIDMKKTLTGSYTPRPCKANEKCTIKTSILSTSTATDDGKGTCQAGKLSKTRCHASECKGKQPGDSCELATKKHGPSGDGKCVELAGEVSCQHRVCGKGTVGEACKLKIAGNKFVEGTCKEVGINGVCESTHMKNLALAKIELEASIDLEATKKAERNALNRKYEAAENAFETAKKAVAKSKKHFAELLLQKVTMMPYSEVKDKLLLEIADNEAKQKEAEEAMKEAALAKQNRGGLNNAAEIARNARSKVDRLEEAVKNEQSMAPGIDYRTTGGQVLKSAWSTATRFAPKNIALSWDNDWVLASSGCAEPSMTGMYQTGKNTCPGPGFKNECTEVTNNADSSPYAPPSPSTSPVPAVSPSTSPVPAVSPSPSPPIPFAASPSPSPSKSNVTADGGGRRRLSTSAVNTAIKRLDATVKPVLAYLDSGVATNSFCFGNEDAFDCTDPMKHIFGEISILPPKCGNARTELTAKIDLLTLGALANLVDGSLGSKMGPVGSMGLKDIAARVVVTEETVTFSAQGKPALPTGKDHVFFKLVNKVVKQTGLEFKVGAELRFSGLVAEVNCSVGFSPPPKDDFNMTAEVFVRGKVARSAGEASVSAGIRGTFFFGVGEPSARETVAFRGELYATAVAVPKPSVVVNGDLAMVGGTWWNALGTNYLHISSVVLGMGMDVTVFPSIPSRLEVGGSLCFGTEAACKDPASKDNDVIMAAAYVGLNMLQPSENYGILLVSKLTFGKVLAVMGSTNTISASLKEKLDLMPARLLSSGISPFDESKCDTTINATYGDRSTLSLGCFAYITASPSQSRTLEQTFGGGEPIEIKKGFSVSGTLSLFDKVVIRLKAEIDPGRRFYVDATIKEIDLYGLIQIGAKLNADNVAVGDPQFVMDYQIIPAPAAYTHIVGAFSIPMLKSYGEVSILLNDQGFSFDTEISLFGGLLAVDATAMWDWDFNYFRMTIAASTPFNLGFSISGTDDKSTPAVAMWNRTSRALYIDAHVHALGWNAAVQFGVVGEDSTKSWLGMIIGPGGWYGSVAVDAFLGLVSGTAQIAFDPVKIGGNTYSRFAVALSGKVRADQGVR